MSSVKESDGKNRTQANKKARLIEKATKWVQFFEEKLEKLEEYRILRSDIPNSHYDIVLEMLENKKYHCLQINQNVCKHKCSGEDCDTPLCASSENCTCGPSCPKICGHECGSACSVTELVITKMSKMNEKALEWLSKIEKKLEKTDECRFETPNNNLFFAGILLKLLQDKGYEAIYQSEISCPHDVNCGNCDQDENEREVRSRHVHSSKCYSNYFVIRET